MNRKEFLLHCADVLESGKYSQGRNCLCQLDANLDLYNHCCLGVFCEEYNLLVDKLDITRISPSPNGNRVKFENQYNYLPAKVTNFLKMTTCGKFKENETLANLNDRRVQFSTIAKTIRENIDNFEYFYEEEKSQLPALHQEKS